MREKYVEALCREIEHEGGCSQWSQDKRSAGTVYIGGGTPSVLTIRQLGKIIDTIRKHFPLSAPQEFTIEVNPDDITPEYASGLKKLSVNRISMGVQSFHDSALKWMNRRHTADKAREAFNTLRCCGFENISLDLIFGYASLSEQMWKEDLEQICSLAPEHVSAYQMSIEPGSATAAMARRGEKVIHSPQKCALQYSMLQNILKEKGYFQYEISNFAKKGNDGSLMKALHNSSYWSGEPYLGLGPGAHSYSGILHGCKGLHAIRRWNLPSVKRYCSHFSPSGEKKTELPVSGSEHLGITDIFNETIMLRLRTCQGLDPNSLKEISTSLFAETLPRIEKMVENGELLSDGGKIRIPPEKLFVSDGIIRDLFI